MPRKRPSSDTFRLRTPAETAEFHGKDGNPVILTNHESEINQREYVCCVLCGEFVRKGTGGAFLALHQTQHICVTMAEKRALRAEITEVTVALRGLRETVSAINAHGESTIILSAFRWLKCHAVIAEIANSSAPLFLPQTLLLPIPSQGHPVEDLPPHP